MSDSLFIDEKTARILSAAKEKNILVYPNPVSENTYCNRKSGELKAYKQLARWFLKGEIQMNFGLAK